ncbi:MAG: Sapep family Mn(2+)-dependent dipeptidase, partial [Bacilli bacterium]
MKYLEKAQAYQQAFINDLSKLVAIKSVYDPSTISKNAPFGQGIRDCFDEMIALGKKQELEVIDYDGYVLEMNCGVGHETIAVLAHLDVVPEGDLSTWKTNPYQMIQQGNMLLGRGVADDKGPALATLYALKILLDEGLVLKKKISFIFGGAEETSWACMDYYFNTLKKPQPLFGFTPDANFPLISGEKGLLT